MKKTLTKYDFELIQNRVNEIWRAGFCLETVQEAIDSNLQGKDGKYRVEVLKEHVVTCADCSNAAWLKNVEADLAKQLGPETTKVFNDGGNILEMPGASKKVLPLVEKYVKSRKDSKEYTEWMGKVYARPQLLLSKDFKVSIDSGLAAFRLPGPVNKDGKPTFLSGKNLVVDLYLTTLDTLRTSKNIEIAAGKDVEASRVEFETKKGNSVRWALLNQARIFEIPTALYQAFYHLADKLTTKLSGWDWKPAKRNAVGEIELDDEIQKSINKYASIYETTVQKHCKYMWPDKFPFDTCYLALTPPLEMNEIQRGLFGVENCDEAWLYAFLVTSDGYVCTFIDVVKGTNAGVASVVECSKVDELRTWGFPLTLSPWAVTWMIEWINEHQVTVEDKTCSFSYRSSYKKGSKKLNMHSIPPPYYTITMREDLLQAKEQKVMTTPRKHWELQYRHDVRGSTNCRIMRGPLPLDPQLEKLLCRDKRRKVFTDTLPDEETARELAKRKVSPKRKDEWLAVLLYWRKDHIKGPKDAPFIPAIRRSSRKRLPKIEDENAQQT